MAGDDEQIYSVCRRLIFQPQTDPEIIRYRQEALMDAFSHPNVIRELYRECLEDSLILGVFRNEQFCGLAEVYGYRAPINKASVGYRLLEEEWGRGIATEALRLLLEELLNRRGIEIITASTMIENLASAHVLQKNGFTQVSHAVLEDWGYPQLTLTDKWIR